MPRSVDRILTTHAGSLPRPPDLIELMWQKERGELTDLTAFNARVRSAVFETVQKQVDAGISIVNDGEVGKPGYATYVKDRLSGFGGEHRFPVRLGFEARDFPEYTERRAIHASSILARPACNAPLAWRDFDDVKRDVATLKEALQGVSVAGGFMTAASPGVVPLFLGNDYYRTEDEFLQVLADLLRQEYEAIAAAGFDLEIDCPDVAMGRHFVDTDTAGFRRIVARNLALVDEATKNIPPERLRLHLCWGNYEGPHHLDIPIKDIVDLVVAARPSAISFEAANPRHAHEWVVWRDAKLPDDKVLIPGLIDSTSNFIEHPEWVAQRIGQFVSIVGRERVIGGTDCGFGTNAASTLVDARIAWAKLKSLAEGAEIASREQWR